MASPSGKSVPSQSSVAWLDLPLFLHEELSMPSLACQHGVVGGRAGGCLLSSRPLQRPGPALSLALNLRSPWQSSSAPPNLSIDHLPPVGAGYAQDRLRDPCYDPPACMQLVLDT
jgi:hypothetical protein